MYFNYKKGNHILKRDEKTDLKNIITKKKNV